MDASLAPDARADLLVAELTLDEQIRLLHSHFAAVDPGLTMAGPLGSAAFTPGVERLGLPPVHESDASLGVAYAHGVRGDQPVTALPSGLAMGSTFDPALVRRAGAVIAAEARAQGFIVLLAGGANLVREPRGGRVFEYVSEDPLLTGRLAGAAIAGIQSAGVVSTVKHFAVNPQETGRVMVSSQLSEAALRESDLLAFELAIEDGRPGSVMTAYNSVNGSQASQEPFILGVLKDDWAYPGFVMSDWGGVHSTEAAILAGLDRQSGQELDTDVFFGDALMSAVLDGRVPRDRVVDATRRVLRSLIEVGWLDDPPRPGGSIDLVPHGVLAQQVAEQGVVLLRNEGVLPFSTDVSRVAVIGLQADSGVLSGGGSSQVHPPGSLSSPAPAWAQTESPVIHHPSSLLAALQEAMPTAEVLFDSGADVAAAAALAAEVDVAVIVVEQWMTEAADVPDLSLPDGQDDLVRAVAAAASSTGCRVVVILTTGGPVLLPWLGSVAAVVAAWYPGARGGEAIAAVLTGSVNPSGRLPVSFPASPDQLPRPVMTDPTTTQSNPGQPRFGAFTVDYDIEGADVGYRWYTRQGSRPAFAFGHGLSYTSFAYTDLAVLVDGDSVTASFTVTNTGPVAGADVPQVYVRPPEAAAARLAGWARLELAPGQASRVEIPLEPRVLAGYDVARGRWQRGPGRYAVSVRRDAETAVLLAETWLSAAPD